MARERNSRPSSCEEAYGRDKRARQSAPRLENSKLRSVYWRSSIDFVSRRGYSLGSRGPRRMASVSPFCYTGAQPVDILKPKNGNRIRTVGLTNGFQQA
jgi:hypothetical protein